MRFAGHLNTGLALAFVDNTGRKHGAGTSAETMARLQEFPPANSAFASDFSRQAGRTVHLCPVEAARSGLLILNGPQPLPAGERAASVWELASQPGASRPAQAWGGKSVLTVNYYHHWLEVAQDGGLGHPRILLQKEEAVHHMEPQRPTFCQFSGPSGRAVRPHQGLSTSCWSAWPAGLLSISPPGPAPRCRPANSDAIERSGMAWPPRVHRGRTKMCFLPCHCFAPAPDAPVCLVPPVASRHDPSGLNDNSSKSSKSNKSTNSGG